MWNGRDKGNENPLRIRAYANRVIRRSKTDLRAERKGRLRILEGILEIAVSPRAPASRKWDGAADRKGFSHDGVEARLLGVPFLLDTCAWTMSGSGVNFGRRVIKLSDKVQPSSTRWPQGASFRPLSSLMFLTSLNLLTS